MPFTRSIEPPSVSRKSWQPKSLAGAKPAIQSQASSRLTFLVTFEKTTAISPS